MPACPRRPSSPVLQNLIFGTHRPSSPILQNLIFGTHRMLAGGSPVSIYRSKDGGASWKRMPDPQLPIHAKMPFPCRVMRFGPHSRRRGEVFYVLEGMGVVRWTV